MSSPVRTVRQAVTPRGRLVLLLALCLVVAGTAWRYPVLAGLGLVLGLLVVIEVVAVLRAPLPEVSRSISPLVVVRRGPCHGRLTLRGGGTGRLVRTDAADLVDGRLVPVELPASGHGRREVEYAVPTPRRGLVPVGPLRVRVSSLAGTAARSAETGDVVQVRVLPRRIPLTSMTSGHRRTVMGGEDSSEQGGTDLVGLHEYTMGDDLRRLHWATSARTGTLMVREDADPAEPHVCVVLDDRAASHPVTGASGAEADEHDTFEEAVELAAALCRAAVERGHPLRFRLASGREEIVVPGTAARTPRREARDVEWLLAEVGTVEASGVPDAGARQLDVLAVVTGPAAGAGPGLRDLVRRLPGALDTRVCVVDPAPDLAAVHENGVLVLRGAGSRALARLWDEAVLR